MSNRGAPPRKVAWTEGNPDIDADPPKDGTPGADGKDGEDAPVGLVEMIMSATDAEIAVAGELLLARLFGG